MKHSYVVAAVAAVVCAGQVASAEDAGTVYIGKAAPFMDAAAIKANIVSECDLPGAQMKLLREQAPAAGITLVEDEPAVAAKKGRVLLIEIFNAVSQGNAFIGHGKQVVLKGRLLENGTEIGNFVATRGSMGGAFAGYKSSCAVLHRCQGALAKDILKWLKSPAKDSRIGE
jgi:hypothetical protein